MRFWTAHVRPTSEPMLVPEGFSWGAFLFGPLWLAVHRAWVPAALDLVASILLATLVHEPASIVLGVGLATFLGLTGNDLRRWSLGRRGFLLTHALAAPTEADAWERLLSARPDLVQRFLPAGAV